MEDILVTEEEKENLSALDFMLECFPKDKKRSDGRLWLLAAPSRRVRF